MWDPFEQIVRSKIAIPNIFILPFEYLIFFYVHDLFLTKSEQKLIMRTLCVLTDLFYLNRLNYIKKSSKLIKLFYKTKWNLKLHVNLSLYCFIIIENGLIAAFIKSQASERPPLIFMI